MREESRHSLRQLRKAFARLQESVQKAKSDLIRDAAVQRFEFTFELIWKTLKRMLEERGIVTTTPKDCLEAALKVGWISNDLVFMDMLEARNQMSHEYDEAEARIVFRKIKKRFMKPIRQLIEQLEEVTKKKS